MRSIIQGLKTLFWSSENDSRHAARKTQQIPTLAAAAATVNSYIDPSLHTVAI
jgi:hypothetical protein